MRKTISVEDIHLSLDNPRNTESENEDEALRKLVKKENKKLLELADDIVNFGLNPLENIGVFPSEEYDGKYIVAEGNRRVVTIKILNNPKKVQELDLYLYSKFSELASEYEAIKKIEVFIFKDEYEANYSHWMEIKHLGEQKGRGITKWGAEEKARYDKNKTGKNILIDFWDELDKNGILSYYEIRMITKTNWERILRNIGLEFLNILKKDDKYIIPYKELEDFKKKIKCIHRRLAGKSVGYVYNQELIESFLNEVREELYGTFENTHDNQSSFFEDDNSEQDKKDENIYEEDKADNDTKTEEKTETDTGKAVSKNKKDLFNGCKTIIPNGFKIRSSNARINRVVSELKTLNPDDYPNACGVLLRVLFELSAKHYNEKDGIIDKTEEEFLQTVTQASNKLKEENKINKTEHSALKKEKDTLRLIFNGYMHNTESYPSAEALKSIFKAHKKFICACLK